MSQITRVVHPWGIELVAEPVRGVTLTAEVRPKGHIRFNLHGSAVGVMPSMIVAMNNLSIALLAEAKKEAERLKKR